FHGYLISLTRVALVVSFACTTRRAFSRAFAWCRASTPTSCREMQLLIWASTLTSNIRARDWVGAAHETKKAAMPQMMSFFMVGCLLFHHFSTKLSWIH